MRIFVQSTVDRGRGCFRAGFREIKVEISSRICITRKVRRGRSKDSCCSAIRVTDKLHKFVPGKGRSDFEAVAGGPIGNAFDAQGRLYTCEFRERRVTRTAKNGKSEVLAARFEGKRLNAPNDIAVRRDGNVYFTDPGVRQSAGHARAGFLRRVSHLKPKGELEAVARWKTRPNGIALSPNGRCCMWRIRMRAASALTI